MKLLVGIALMVFALEAASAQTFLACDPYATTDAPDQFVLTFDGGAPVVAPAFVNPDGRKSLKFDITTIVAGWAAGSHTVTAKAVKLPSATDIGGESAVATTTLKKSVPAIPANVGVRFQ